MIREQEQFHEVPIIIMLTASNDSPDIEKALKLGANGYQVKPFELDDFISFFASLVDDEPGA